MSNSRMTTSQFSLVKSSLVKFSSVKEKHHHPVNGTTYDLHQTSDDDFHSFDTRGVF